MRKLLIASAIGCVCGTSHAALDWLATTLVTVNGYSGAPFAATGLADAGWLDSQIVAHGSGTLTVTLLGREASLTDSFSTGGASLLNSAAVGTMLSVPITASGDTPLSFTFKDDFTGDTIANGGSPSGTATYAVLGVKVSPTHPSTCGFPDMCEIFKAKVNGSTQTFDVILGFNDSGPDKDYDDMVVGLKFAAAAAVPEPHSATLMLAGLGIAAMVARRRRR